MVGAPRPFTSSEFLRKGVQMAEYTVHDRSGNTVGHISDSHSSGEGCVGCIGLSVIIAVLYGVFSFYQFVQSRIADNKIESQRVVLNSDTLNSYTGQYDYGRYKIKIEHRGNKLFNISDEEFCELMPISTQEFIYRNCVLGFQGHAKFIKDVRGKMDLVIVHPDGHTEQAPRVK